MDSKSLEDELDRTGVTQHLKDALAVLLEARPANPLAFLGSYFKHAAQTQDPVSRAYRLIHECLPTRACFNDNVYSAFCALARRQALTTGNSEGVTSSDFAALLRLICSSLPAEVTDALLSDCASVDPVSFGDFSLGVEACLLTEKALQGASQIFERCDD